MTVMFPLFFGVPQAAMRLGTISRLSGAALKLYVALCHESERYRTREITRTVTELRKLVGGAPNSHIKARRELVAVGLAEFENLGADGVLFRLCDPETGKPWPSDSKERVLYQKQTAQQPRSSIVNQADPQRSPSQNPESESAYQRPTSPRHVAPSSTERRRHTTSAAPAAWNPPEQLPEIDYSQSPLTVSEPESIDAIPPWLESPFSRDWRSNS